jgi:hypothetical protein
MLLIVAKGWLRGEPCPRIEGRIVILMGKSVDFHIFTNYLLLLQVVDPIFNVFILFCGIYLRVS